MVLCVYYAIYIYQLILLPESHKVSGRVIDTLIRYRNFRLDFEQNITIFISTLLLLLMILFIIEPVWRVVDLRYVWIFLKEVFFFCFSFIFIQKELVHIVWSVSTTVASVFMLIIFFPLHKCHMCGRLRCEFCCRITIHSFLKQLNDLEFSVSFFVDDVT